MKPRTIARLDILAAAREARLQEAASRHGAALDHAREQGALLAAYRDRLGASWRDGAADPAVKARRASRFVSGAQTAAAQIEAASAKAAEQLQEAVTALAHVQTHRRGLARALQAHARAEAAQAEQKAERDRPWRRA